MLSGPADRVPLLVISRPEASADASVLAWSEAAEVFRHIVTSTHETT